jgi:hypothetical protein
MADKIVVLRPNVLHRADNWVAVDGRTGSVNTVRENYPGYTSDQIDATYVESPSGIVAPLDLHFTTFQFPTRSQIRWVRPVLRVSVITADDGWISLNVRLARGTTDVFHPLIQRIDFQRNWGIVTMRLGAVTTNHRGDQWTQADIDSIRCAAWRTFDWDRDRPLIHDEWLEVAYNEAPTWAFTGPVDQDPNVAGVQVIDTSNPTISGTFADPNGDRKERHHVRVWPESEYTKAGFRVEAPSPTNPSMVNRPPGEVWGEGPVLSEATSFKVGKPLPNGKYRAYVAVADAGWVGLPRYGALADGTLPFIEWTQQIPSPPAPTLALSVDVANGRMVLAATAAAAAPNTEFVRFEYYDGTSWVALRGFEWVAATPGQTVTAYDYEAAPAAPQKYRVRAGRTVDGFELVSNASAVQTGIQVLDGWWLKDPLNPTRNRPVELYRRRGDVVRESVAQEQQKEFEVIGRPYPVTLSGGDQGERFEVIFNLYGHTEREWFETIRKGTNGSRILLLQNPHGQGSEAQWYVRFGRERQRQTMVAQGYPQDPLFRVTVECSERGRP